MTLCDNYAQHATIVQQLLCEFPGAWTAPVGGIPLAIQLYTSKAGTNGDLFPLFLSATDKAIAEVQHPDTGDTVLHHAAENMHVSVVEHFLITLRCHLVANKAGHHALFAPFIAGTVEAEPMERMIRVFHRAHQRNFVLYDPNQVVSDTTILGMIAKYPYAQLLHAWTDSNACDGKISARQHIRNSMTVPSSVKAALEQSVGVDRKAKIIGYIKANDAAGLRLLLQRGFLFERSCPGGSVHAVSPLSLACELETTEMLALLLEYGANVNKGCTCGKSGILPLSAAIFRQRMAHFQMLRNHGAKFQQQEHIDDLAPLIMAMRSPMFRPTLSDVLDEIDFSVSYKRIHCQNSTTTWTIGMSIISLSFETEDLEFIQKMMKYINKAPRSRYYTSAVAIGNEAILKMLIAIPSLPTGVASLVMAAQNQRKDMFELIFPLMCSNSKQAYEHFSYQIPKACENCRSPTDHPDTTVIIREMCEKWLRI